MLGRAAAISPGVRRIPTLMVFPTRIETPKATPRTRNSECFESVTEGELKGELKLELRAGCAVQAG